MHRPVPGTESDKSIAAVGRSGKRTENNFTHCRFDTQTCKNATGASVNKTPSENSLEKRPKSLVRRNGDHISWTATSRLGVIRGLGYQKPRAPHQAVCTLKMNRWSYQARHDCQVSLAVPSTMQQRHQACEALEQFLPGLCR